MATQVDIEALRALAARVDAAAPPHPQARSSMSADVVGHAGVAAAMSQFEDAGVDAVVKLNVDAAKISGGLRDVAAIYEHADGSADQAARDVTSELGE